MVNIVRAFLQKHGFAKHRVDTTCEEWIGEVPNSLPTEKKRKRDWKEAPATEASFTRNTTSSTKSGGSQPSIGLIGDTKHNGAMTIRAVRASDTQSRSLPYYSRRTLLWIKRKTCSGSIHEPISLTKSIDAPELQPGFVKDPRPPFLPRHAVLT